MPVPAQRVGDPVPVAAVIPPAMNQEQWRRGRIAPVDIMQAKSLRETDPRGWPGAVEVQKQGPPCARWRQAGVAIAKLSSALGGLGRALSWTFNLVADAKRSATASLQVASCLWHTLPAGCRRISSKDGSRPPSRAKFDSFCSKERSDASGRLKPSASWFIFLALSHGEC